MSGDLPRGPGGPAGDPSGRDLFSDDAALVEALRRLGEQHEPDTEAIWARVDPARLGDPALGDPRLGDQDRGGDPDVVRLDGRRDRHPRFDGGRPRRPWVVAGLAAASVLGVLVAAQVFVLDGPDGTTSVAQSPTVQVSTPGPVTSSVEPTPVPSSTALGSPTATSVPTTGTRTGTPSPSQAPSSAPPAPTTTGTPPSSPAPSPSRPADTGQVVAFAPLVATQTTFGTSSEGYLDWIVPNRGDGVAVRAKRPVDGSGIDVVVPPRAVANSSRMVLAWVDGVPEQTGSTNVWFVGQPGESWSVTVHGSAYDRWLVLQVGNSSGVSVNVQGPNRTGFGRASFAGRKLVTVRIPASAGTTTVTLTGDDVDGLAVGSVALQRA